MATKERNGIFSYSSTKQHHKDQFNHIISEYGELAQKEYWTRHDREGKVILWELCKKLKFDHTTKWYIHKP